MLCHFNQSKRYIQKWMYKIINLFYYYIYIFFIYYKVKSEASSSETKTVIAAHTSLEYFSVGGTGYFEGEVSSGDNYSWKECKNTYHLGWN